MEKTHNKTHAITMPMHVCYTHTTLADIHQYTHTPLSSARAQIIRLRLVVNLMQSA